MIPATFALAALLLGAVALRHARWLHVAAYVASVVCVVVAIVSALGAPRPAWLGHKPGLTVLALTYQEGSWIALWTQHGHDAPVAYVLPWYEITAAQAEQAMRQAQQQHSTMQWGKPAHGQGNGSKQGAGHGASASGAAGASNTFHVAPISPLPPKVMP